MDLFFYVLQTYFKQKYILVHMLLDWKKIFFIYSINFLVQIFAVGFR